MPTGLNTIAYIAEQKIKDAMAEGQFDNLPGAGKPLQLEDMSNIPEDMRMAYTLLRTSGYIDKPDDPPSNMSALLEKLPEEKHSYRKIQRFKIMMRKAGKTVDDDSPYLKNILDKL